MKPTGISSRPSKAKRDFDAEYAAILPSVLARGCEFAAYVSLMPSGRVLHACSGRLLGHHAKGRRAADANDPTHLRCLCQSHHDYVHANPRWSREVGLMLSRIS